MDKYINATALLKYLHKKYDGKISLNSVTEITLKEKEHIEYAISLIENAIRLYGVSSNLDTEQNDCISTTESWWGGIGRSKPEEE